MGETHQLDEARLPHQGAACCRRAPGRGARAEPRTAARRAPAPANAADPQSAVLRGEDLALGLRVSGGIGFAGMAAVLLVASPAAALQPLETFVASARGHNPDTRESRAALAQQRAQADVALGRALPGVSLSGSYTRNQYESQVSIPGPSGAAQTVTLTPFDQWSGTATLTVPLIDRKSFRRIAAARTSGEGAARQLDATGLQVEGQVIQDYYQLVANLALVAASNEALDV